MDPLTGEPDLTNYGATTSKHFILVYMIAAYCSMSVSSANSLRCLNILDGRTASKSIDQRLRGILGAEQGEPCVVLEHQFPSSKNRFATITCIYKPGISLFVVHRNKQRPISFLRPGFEFSSRLCQDRQ